MDKRLLDVDPVTGIKTYHSYDYNSNITYIQKVQDVEPILERNKALANSEHQAKGIKSCWWHHATIPNTVIEAWLKEGVDIFSKAPEQKKLVRRMLNHPDWRYLRTGSGKL